MAEDTAEGLKDAIRVDTAELRGHVDAVVRSSVEETLNALLQAEADQICKAGRYERSPQRGRYAGGTLRAEAGDQRRRGGASRCRSCARCRSRRRLSNRYVWTQFGTLSGTPHLISTNVRGTTQRRAGIISYQSNIYSGIDSRRTKLKAEIVSRVDKDRVTR